MSEPDEFESMLGHNSKAAEKEPEPETKKGGIAGEQLRSIVERIERLEKEKKAIGDDVRDVYAEAKGNGFDTKALRQLIKLRKLDAAERAEQEAILDLYLHAMGML
jgi:uncharacterized protein (UPF0335 family)